MSGVGCSPCRLCLGTINDYEFHIIGEITRRKLDELLLKLNLNINKDVICMECMTKLQMAWDFKSACLNAQPKFLPFNTYEENVKEDILNKNGTEEFIQNRKLCQFCMKVAKIGCYTYLHEKKENVFILDMVQKHIPELSLTTTDEVISCELCLNSLQNLLDFITVCYEAEEKIKHANAVKCESKQDDGKDFTLNKIDCSDVNVSKIEKIKEKEINISIKVETPDEDPTEIQHPELQIKDEPESFEDATSSEKEDVSACSQERYRCKSCPYKTRLARLLKKHMAIHEELSGVTVYKCARCSYMTNYKSYFKKHTLNHERSPESRIYYCNNCSFQSKYRRNLREHVLTHRDISEIKTYKCPKCLYGSNRKSQLKRHMLIHQDISEVTTYKCEFEGCSYVTKRRDCVKGHMLIHRNSSETYKCKHCDYEAKRKCNLYIHTMNHHDHSNKQTFRCGLCLYETSRKGYLRNHMLVHRKASKERTHRCRKCAFDTKSIVDFRRHRLTHQELSETSGYRCGKCSYETSHESDLARHALVHLELVAIKTEISM